MSESTITSSHAMTAVEADQRPDLSAALDNPAIFDLVQETDQALEVALHNILMLLGTQVSRDQQITRMGKDALKIRSALIKAQSRLSNILDRGIDRGQIMTVEDAQRMVLDAIQNGLED